MLQWFKDKFLKSKLPVIGGLYVLRSEKNNPFKDKYNYRRVFDVQDNWVQYYVGKGEDEEDYKSSSSIDSFDFQYELTDD